MIDNIALHADAYQGLAVLFIVAVIILGACATYFLKQQKTYGRMFEFAGTPQKTLGALSLATVVSIGIFFSTSYSPPPTGQIAIILGNTQNTPAPQISGSISTAIADAMHVHKGEDAETVIESIRFISAVKQPQLVNIEGSDVKFRKISNNNANAKRDIRLNIEAIESAIKDLPPVDNGANYLEAILAARDNLEPGSRIIVIGSGLSDNGYLDFSKSNILTNEAERSSSIDDVAEEYGQDSLEGYTVEFHGLGDTNTPQEALSSIQKGIVRDIYRSTIRKLGGTAVINTRTLSGPSVETKFAVGTTDTGCGDINLIFDNKDLNFFGDLATFRDRAAATKTLSTVSDIWSKQRDTIESIQVDGYTAHYPGADSLSQDRANTVMSMLVELGVDSDKITATGKGYGPYETDEQNRTVKVNISRDSKQCVN